MSLLANLGAYVLQVGLLMAVGLLLPRLLGVRQPLVRLRYWQGLLAVTLLLPLLQPWRTPSADVGVVATVALRAEAVVPVAGTDFGSFLSLPFPLLVGAVALGRLLWLLVGLWTLGRYRREASALRPVPPEVAAMQERLATRAEILLSERISAPVTFGWRRPAILVPKAFQGLSPGERRGIACHELLHVRRRDWPAVILEEILKSVAWFHPAVWILLGRIALSREQVVDREVVRITRQKRAYLEALWTIARDRRPGAAVLGLSFFQRSQLFHRVALMTKEVSMSRPRLLITVSALTGLLALTLVFAATAFPLMTAPDGAAVEELAAAETRGSAEEEPASRQGRIAAEPIATEQPRQEPRRVEGDVIAPRAIHKPQPLYPDSARKAGTGGVVIVQSVIGTQGDVVGLKVLRSEREDLAAAALKAIRQWRFEPATLYGKPVDVYYNLTVNFRLV